MKTFKNCIAVFMILSAVGCKDEIILPEEKKIPESPVQVTAEMIVEENDIFELFYTSDGSGNFSADKSVRVNVHGNPESQQIVFNLPQDAHITNIRLDVGQNPHQDEMTVNKLIIKQQDKKLEIKAAEFFSYFGNNEFVDTNAKKFTFETNEEGSMYDPLFYAKEPLVKKLKMFY